MFRRLLRFSVLCVILMLIFSQYILPLLGNNVYAGSAPATGLNVQLSVDNSNVVPGMVFSYNVAYSVSDIESNYSDVWIYDTLDSRLEYVSVENNGQLVVASVTPVPNGDDPSKTDLSFQISNDGNALSNLDAGSTGVIQVRVRVKEGTIGNGSVIPNYVTIGGTRILTSSPLTGSSQTVNVITTGVFSKWQISKSRISPSASVNPQLDTDVTFRVTVNEPGGTDGNLNLHDLMIIDQLSHDVVFVAATGSGEYDALTNTVTWTIGDLNVNSLVARDVTVRFPSGVYEYTVNNTETNTAEAGAKDPDNNEISMSPVTVTVTPEEPKPPVSEDFNYRCTSRKG